MAGLERPPLETSEAIIRLDSIIELLTNLQKTISENIGIIPYQREMEYYDFDEQVAINVTTAPTPAHEFKERPVKFMWLYAQGANIQVSLDKAVSGESMIVPQGAIIWIRKKTRRVYGQAVAGTGILRIWGFW